MYTNELDEQAKVAQFLISKNIPMTRGYHFLKSCLIKVLEDPEYFSTAYQNLYRQVADEYGTTTSNIDRCLRTLTNSWWKQHSCGGLFTEKPSVKRCISVIVEHIENNLEVPKIQENITRLPSAYDILLR